MTAYAELQVTTNFSFLRGGSHPGELVARAAELGLCAIAVTDRNTLSGVVRAHRAAKEVGLRLVVGCRLVLADGPDLLCFPEDRAAYGRLARLLTLGKRRAKKGECLLTLADAIEYGTGQIVVVVPPADFPQPDCADAFARSLARVAECFAGRCYLAISHSYRGQDARRLSALAELAAVHNVALVATNDVQAHHPDRRRLLDVLTCIREHCTIDEAGYRLAANVERHLKPGAEMARLFRRYPDAVRRSLEIVARARFDLDELRYEYPADPVRDGLTPQQELERLAWLGAEKHYPGGLPEKVRAQIAHELALIGQLGYAPYFLTVHDIVRFARARAILCQGRGSAANSAVCYCLGITAIDPAHIDLLFERFISVERNEPPDIDVDFEHERREEVIQYIYAKYGRERAGLAATLITYRSRSAIREVGKALGLSTDSVGALAGTIWGRSRSGVDSGQTREAGLDPADRRLALALDLTRQLIGFPRHLSQHVGGFVITRGRLDELVPIENAAMEDRTVIEWDKDDLDALGILKIDVLSLGMLSCIRKCFAMIERHHGRRFDLATVPQDDPAVYAMLSKGDSLGVFQVESRAQMTMLPRLKPRNFYDLVIEVAIVRPGPIQGDMVHPYLRRRGGEEKVEYPSEELRQVLEKTLGVPLFQEQAMKIAIVAAGFAPSEADRLRRAMATFRHTGTIHGFRDKFIEGMAARGYARDFAERCFKQIEGFGEYGFPESHAASFALLVYISAWMHCHYPAAFAAALINSQPMGFYAPAQIVRDVRAHGVTVLPADVNRSDWDCTLEADGDGVAIRLGLRLIKGLAEEAGRRIAAGRASGGNFADATALARRAGLTPAILDRLAEADALASLGRDRRHALWDVRGVETAQLPLFAAAPEEEKIAARSPQPEAKLPALSAGEQVVGDYRAVGLTLRQHPLALIRPYLPSRTATSAQLAGLPDGRRVAVAGLVFVRQRPGTAKGVVFLTMEDETGIANLIVWPKTFERFRPAAMGARLLLAEGELQRQGPVIHVVARRLTDLSYHLNRLAEPPQELLLPPGSAGESGEATRKLPARMNLRSRNFH